MNEANPISILKDKFPVLSQETISGYVIARPEDIEPICLFLKKELSFDYLMSLSALDYKDRLALVYHLYSFKSKDKISLKVFLDKDNPSIKTVSNVWASSNWHEREAYDLMGINFIGHPNLKRILLPDNWIGHPLRKDYNKEGLIKMPQV